MCQRLTQDGECGLNSAGSIHMHQYAHFEKFPIVLHYFADSATLLAIPMLCQYLPLLTYSGTRLMFYSTPACPPFRPVSLLSLISTKTLDAPLSSRP